MQDYRDTAIIENDQMTDVERSRAWRIAAWAAAAILLLVPWVAMQLTDEVNWTAGDFALAALLLFGSLATWELVTRNRDRSAYRAAVGVTLLGVVLLIWVNGAVGIIGSENNEANLMFAGVLAVLLAGAAIARLQPHGMARTLYATAVAQALVAAITIAGQLGADGHNWPWDVVGATAFFVILWLVAAQLFHSASRSENNTDPAA